MSGAFSKCISCVSRCARELLFRMYFVVLSAKAEAFGSSSPITIHFLMLLFFLMLTKNISTNIMYRIIDNWHPCRSPLFYSLYRSVLSISLKVTEWLIVFERLFCFFIFCDCYFLIAFTSLFGWNFLFNLRNQGRLQS